MANPRGTVTIGTGGAALTLVADIGQYRPFSEVALGVRVFDGVEDVTIQDFGFRAARQQGTLASGGGESPGLIATATLAALRALLTAWGASQPLTDSLGNAGTIRASDFAEGLEYHVPGAQGALHGYTLTFRWLTLTMLYGAPYTGR
jgi:hypothetical protein